MDGANTLHISIVTAWEIAIKASVGKLHEFNGGVKIFFAKIEEMPVFSLSILPRHLEMVETLPFIHRAPFDRLLVATAKAEAMTILTADENIHQYEALSVCYTQNGEKLVF